MQHIRLTICTLLAAAAMAAGPAFANTCQTDGGLTCPTGMPIEGYCECTSHGVTQGGTVVQAAVPRQSRRMPPPDCRATPQAPGCPHP